MFKHFLNIQSKYPPVFRSCSSNYQMWIEWILMCLNCFHKYCKMAFMKPLLAKIYTVTILLFIWWLDFILHIKTVYAASFSSLQSSLDHIISKVVVIKVEKCKNFHIYITQTLVYFTMTSVSMLSRQLATLSEIFPKGRDNLWGVLHPLT